MRADFRTR